MLSAIDFALELIRFDSVSRRSNLAISQAVASHLKRLSFEIEWLTYVDENGQTKVNIIAKREPRTAETPSYGNSGIRFNGGQNGGITYMAHTDVVPADDWSSNEGGPFEPWIRDDRLWGRGSCDMKGSLACALAAIERIPIEAQFAPIFVICTADEELGTIGAGQVDRESRLFQEIVDRESVGIVGEPTMLNVVHAHKGCTGIELTSRGRSAHSSSRDGINANHRLIPILKTLLEIYNLCENDTSLHNLEFDPPTLSWNIIIRNEPAAVNITPSLAQASIFFRPMPGVEHEQLVRRVRQESESLGLDFRLFEKTPPLAVPLDSPFVREMIDIAGCQRATTACFATDGGVLRRIRQLVVCGPGSIEQAHRPDEFISLEQLRLGTQLYETAFRRWSCTHKEQERIN